MATLAASTISQQTARESLPGTEKDIEASSAAVSTTENSQDEGNPNIVDWEGPDDPLNPLNWPSKKKITAITIVSLITFITPLASTIFTPALDKVMLEFDSTDKELASFIMSVYLLGYVFGPLAIAPLSEMYGRSPVYHVNNVFFVIWSIACALAPTLNSLIVFRFFAGVSGSCPVTIGAATIADLIPQDRRGFAMSAWFIGPLLGPIIGPVAGGYLTQAKDWRWSFWVVAIVSVAVTIPCFLFLHETYAPAILEKKTRKLRKSTGNPDLRSKLTLDKTKKEAFSNAIVRPAKMLVVSPIVSLMSLYTAGLYGYLYLTVTAMSYVFGGLYGFDTGAVGLAFLGSGVGSFTGLLILGVFSDRLVKKLVARNGGEMLPAYRLPLAILGGLCMPIGLFWFGWSAEAKMHWIMPIAGSGWIGAASVLTMLAVQTYLVDAFTKYAASVSAANTVVRSIVGALLPLGGRKIFDTLGVGWGNSVLGFISLAMIPIPLVFYLYGERLRHKTFFRAEL